MTLKYTKYFLWFEWKHDQAFYNKYYSPFFLHLIFNDTQLWRKLKKNIINTIKKNEHSFIGFYQPVNAYYEKNSKIM